MGEIIAILDYPVTEQVIEVDRYKALSDNELLHLLRQDEEPALSELYLRYWDKLLSVAAHRTSEPEAAEEIVQDIFIKLWKRRKELELKYSLSTYLAVAVKYQIINFLEERGRKRLKEARLNDLILPLQASVEERIFEDELRERIAETVKNLPEKCRIVFQMSREEGLSNKQIAKELDIAEKTVEAHMSRALKDIRGNLTTVVPPILLAILEHNRFHL